MNDVRVLLLLTADHARRLLREGIVLRSLVFPVALAVLAVVGTVAAVIWMQPPQRVALTQAEAVPELVEAVRADGYEVLVVRDPGEAVAQRLAVLGTDGETLWIGHGGQPPLALEAHVRRHLGTSWRPHHPRAARARHVQESDAPRRLAVFIGALFALYGVVFGAGGIARDRDEGTLDAELSVAVPHVVHGLARWLSGTVVLTAFFAVSVALLHAVMGVGDPVELALHGAAASGAATAIGLLVIGRAGLDRGFAGPMSGGLVVVFSLLSLGVAGRGGASVLPVASLAAGGAAWPPLALTLLLGGTAALVFARRTAVT